MPDVIARPNTPIFFLANAGLSIASYSWSFPGGTVDNNTSSNPTASYPADGTYTVAVDVVFTNGEVGQDTAIVEIDQNADYTGISVNGDYWNWNGRPKLLLGGFTGGEPFLYKQSDVVASDGTDELSAELNILQAVGGNFMRNTMANFPGYPSQAGKSIQDWPFNGYPNSFDVTSINQQYFDRLDAFLTKAEARGIVVQLEIWEPWILPKSGTWETDGSDGRSSYWNPKNVSNYDTTTGLPTATAADNSSFYATVDNPTAENAIVLTAQRLFVEHVCIEAAKHSNVLIQIENESNATSVWDDYWADYIASLGDFIITTMRDEHQIDNADGSHAMESPKYQFGDSSQQWWDTKNVDDEYRILQNFHGKGAKPVNAEKVYSSFDSQCCFHDKAIDYFFASIIAGNAGCAFHPGTGDDYDEASLGLSGKAQQAIHAGRWLADNSDIEINGAGSINFDDSRWESREANSAYATKLANAFIFFMSSVSSNGFKFDISALTTEDVVVTWYDADNNVVVSSGTVTPTNGVITLAKPSSTTRYLIKVAKPAASGLTIDGRFWKIEGVNKLLIGGTNAGEPNLYEQQYNDNGLSINDSSDFLGDELAKITAAGGNYFRCTLASWHPPYATGAMVISYPFPGYPNNFNLTQINQDYFDRLDAFLYRCEALEITPQLEIWDTWWNIQLEMVWEGDGTVPEHYANAEYNPAHVTSPADYTTANTGLTTTYTPDTNALFTAPALANATSNPLLIAQKVYVAALCVVIKKHPNCLIEIQNESIEPTAWADFWLSFIRTEGVTNYITEMQDSQDITTPDAKYAMSTPEFGFGDNSQGTRSMGPSGGQGDTDDLFNNAINFMNAGNKPANATKIYRYNPKEDGVTIDKMFVLFMAGNAGCAFHPGDGTDNYSGLGVVPEALKAFEAARWMDDNSDISNMSSVPLNDGKWGGRPSNGAYAKSSSNHIVIYVNSGANFAFNTTELGNNMSIRWKDVETGATSGSGSTETSASSGINNPFGGNRAVVVMTRV